MTLFTHVEQVKNKTIVLRIFLTRHVEEELLKET